MTPIQQAMKKVDDASNAIGEEALRAITQEEFGKPIEPNDRRFTKIDGDNFTPAQTKEKAITNMKSVINSQELIIEDKLETIRSLQDDIAVHRSILAAAKSFMRDIDKPVKQPTSKSVKGSPRSDRKRLRSSNGQGAAAKNPAPAKN